MALFDTGMNRGGFSTLLGRIAQWNDERQALKALSRLSARELDDVGLTPGDVDRMMNRVWF